MFTVHACLHASRASPSAEWCGPSFSFSFHYVLSRQITGLNPILRPYPLLKSRIVQVSHYRHPKHKSTYTNDMIAACNSKFMPEPRFLPVVCYLRDVNPMAPRSGNAIGLAGVHFTGQHYQHPAPFRPATAVRFQLVDRKTPNMLLCHLLSPFSRPPELR